MTATATTSRSVLRQAISGQRRRVTLASVLAAGHQGGEALVPVIIGVVIDQAVDGGSVGTLVFWLAVLGVIFAGLSYSYRFAARAAEGASLRAAHDLRLAISRRVLHPGGGADKGKLAGELVNIGTSDAQRVGVVNAALPFGIAALAGVLVSAIALLRISLPLGLLVLLGTPPLLYLAHLIGKPLERRSEAEQERSAHASGVATDLVSGLRVLKGIGAEPAAVARYRETSQNSLKATLRAARAKAWHDGAVLALTGVFIAIVALVGGHLASSGSISVGDLVAAVGLAQFLLTPFLIFSWVNGELAQGRASAARVADLLTTPVAVEPGDGELPSPATGNVRFTEVTYGALRGVDLDIPAGQLIGVVAADPAAATDLLDCLGRAGDPAEGTVHVDGVDLSTVDPDRVREVVLVAAHDADLFEGTLAENVHADGRSAGEALAASAADEVAAALPDGTATAVTERGRSLSGGQRQRVALARALAADAPVLVVHDPTTAVDTVTEAKIATGLARLRRGRTTILVTTSPALLAAADRVVVLDGGRITGEGGHAELARDRADYRAAVLS
ncbi:putative ABC transport system ATP-binding protein [Amycolatopsis lurida]|uniref:Multidrug ABC transporter ATPase n=1 Tax=Amycolatopsis lurida NRRL 2430 TaxID=1460371 RepID=A0A2P2G006_AMYLU|nr:ABC transporter ATP-binding protein [Amycolatopsis lurida]KFU82309.1 multidrug ABC transporter ATPase [Amycolatopsis lurida NRRL 2430]SEC25710.1 putative ABC transport system ATP-binding protein [Amycolatopsis lurida]